ncbi:hypothetical protein [Sphingobacterium rhinopitheci]|uniref:hypothetical protein n=1 Tax=Sphingobacterium rhinopitheci TaxID=2781960 RepID=UPI001F51B4D0|nr:hypothetical protein [Sphingobacterium rhinopitheci]MCI0920658.1 hypothetical protein [Sphingobacterium rhinopitheci]
MCQSTILNTKGNTIISYCPRCQNHYVWQRSFLLTFTLQQFECFASEIHVKQYDREFVRFPDGTFRTYLETPMREVLLTFTELEWFDFSKAIQESYYMREIYEIINKDIKS